MAEGSIAEEHAYEYGQCREYHKKQPAIDQQRCQYQCYNREPNYEHGIRQPLAIHNEEEGEGDEGKAGFLLQDNEPGGHKGYGRGHEAVLKGLKVGLRQRQEFGQRKGSKYLGYLARL